ncbi:peptidoglycan DD-metalloendopeptidase family protein [Iningainema tapete]|uniref:M23 family metallopeptidase n=1 Tax=Iningainema tapete BLCC-T55 TaxID=2748662 RepID=A0A8J7BZZ2_9CYAN|nr:M23 family metallopeptidase [Iningainema tapete]MBD2778772.1 M23 family metallopeptidase [Iningainema tapete BLCC-T55]
MNFRDRLLFLCSFVGTFGLLYTFPSVQAQPSVSACPTSALERFTRHKVLPGETLESIAQRYNLNRETIVAMNPALKNGRVTVGGEIQIPPYNGIVVEVPNGQTWRQLAAKYKIRPDVLFEVNGCQPNPQLVFIPKINQSVKTPQQSVSTPTNVETLRRSVSTVGYPLAELAKEILPYGWQTNTNTGEVFFHSGIDLLAAKGTPVQAIGAGKVAFAEDLGTYGKLVIINHAGGLQSRYAQLDSIAVSRGQQVNKGDAVGTVGTTGKPTSNQPHLHFEVRSSSSLGWVAQDPKNYLQR